MKNFKKFLKISGFILILVVIILWVYANSLKPTYEGKISIKNLSQKVADSIGLSSDRGTDPRAA